MSAPILMGCGCGGAAPPGGDGLDGDCIDLVYFSSRVWVLWVGFQCGHPQSYDPAKWADIFRAGLAVFDTVGNCDRRAFIASFETGSPPSAFNNYFSLSCFAPNVPDGILYVSGLFSKINGRVRSQSGNGIAGIKADGSISGTFIMTDEPDSEPSFLCYDASSGLYAIGPFSNIGSTARRGIARFATNGSHDTSFNPGTGLDGGDAGVITLRGPGTGVYLAAPQYNSVPLAAGMCAITGGGSLDGSFDHTKVLSAGGVSAIVIDNSGKLLVGLTGSATYDGTSVYGIMRLNTDGSIDGSFIPNLGGDGVTSIAVQGDNKILITGTFSTVNGVSRKFAARLNTDGSTDASFNLDYRAGSLAFNLVKVIVLPSDSGLVFGGHFGPYPTGGSSPPPFNASIAGSDRNNIVFTDMSGALLL